MGSLLLHVTTGDLLLRVLPLRGGLNSQMVAAVASHLLGAVCVYSLTVGARSVLFGAVTLLWRSAVLVITFRESVLGVAVVAAGSATAVRVPAVIGVLHA